MEKILPESQFSWAVMYRRRNTSKLRWKGVKTATRLARPLLLFYTLNKRGNHLEDLFWHYLSYIYLVWYWTWQQNIEILLAIKFFNTHRSYIWLQKRIKYIYFESSTHRICYSPCVVNKTKIDNRFECAILVNTI